MHAESPIIFIHDQAPAKPVLGAACNGCGLCCLLEPCPLGMVLSQRRTGACQALRWQESLGRYQCGALVAPQDVLPQALPRRWAGLARWLAPVLRRWAGRWIAAGLGCDSTVERVHADSPTMPHHDH